MGIRASTIRYPNECTPSAAGLAARRGKRSLRPRNFPGGGRRGAILLFAAMGRLKFRGAWFLSPSVNRLPALPATLSWRDEFQKIRLCAF